MALGWKTHDLEMECSLMLGGHPFWEESKQVVVQHVGAKTVTLGGENELLKELAMQLTQESEQQSRRLAEESK
ncbi:hypothetical protein Nepgr_024719 [Nepenthes gracilis]|uniref:Uncharacterized protein n=1 Tax=Nepenthes gracilis TaxID=150966 RepID=A0AAD3Y0S9_NEPGR|nr:hypothetical protein Nepgr_024719 [Nepenthes gracilis]